MQTLKSIIEKEFLFLEQKQNASNLLKVFYKINLKITNTENNKEQPPSEQIPTPETIPPEAAPISTELPAPTPEPITNELPNPNTSAQLPVPSVQTKSLKEADDEENEDEEKVTNDSEIIRKTEGELALSKEEVDEIQTIEDLIDTLGDKDNDGDNILDDFSIEVIKTMISPEAAQKASQVINRDDYIFLDILYGRKKEDDNIGFRITKRKKSDMVSSVILKDGEILNSPFNPKIINDEIVNLRNSVMK
jgi:type IV secretory pathway VirB10-like protein